MIIDTPILDRILNAFPSGAYGLPALLSLSEIVETTEVPTAAVECGTRPRLLINPDFVAKHAQTQEKLVMLVMHELHHVILGHTRLYPRVTALDNLVFDAVINSMLCWMMPDRPTRALFEDLYDHARFPHCFLRPPPGWEGRGQKGTTPEALRAPDLAHLAPLHAKLYSETGTSYEELREALADPARDAPAPPLLGDHGAEGEGSSSDGDLEHRAPELLAHVREVVKRWPPPRHPTASRSLEEFFNRGRVKVPPRSRRERLADLLRRVARRTGTARRRQFEVYQQSVESPLPRLNRRAGVLRALGMTPALFQHSVEWPRVRRGGERVHVYLDVSGSVSSIIGPLYRAVLDCEDSVHRNIHLFSTLVADLDISRLRKGECRTTGGTCIECVAQHMAAHRVRRAVIVTDGYVGAPSDSSRAILMQARLGVALVGANTRDCLDGLVDHWLELTEISHAN